MNLIKRTENDVQKINRMELVPASRVAENEDGFTLTVELPGVGEQDVELTLEYRTLTVTAENAVQSFKDHTQILAEIPETRYRATFELPERVDTSGIKAAHRNGLLILTLPKREEIKPRRIAVEAG